MGEQCLSWCCRKVVQWSFAFLRVSSTGSLGVSGCLLRQGELEPTICGVSTIDDFICQFRLYAVHLFKTRWSFEAFILYHIWRCMWTPTSQTHGLLYKPPNSGRLTCWKTALRHWRCNYECWWQHFSMPYGRLGSMVTRPSLAGQGLLVQRKGVKHFVYQRSLGRWQHKSEHFSGKCAKSHHFLAVGVNHKMIFSGKSVTNS